MLRQRVITAIILLVLFLSALFFLPTAIWGLLVIVMVMQGTSEWARLSNFSRNAAKGYWWATLALLAGVVLLDMNHALPHWLVYAAAALLWLAVAPAWLMAGWQVRQPVLMALTGWALLVPTGLALMDLRAANPWWLLAVMGLVWVADIAAYFAGRKFGKTKLAPRISPGKTWEGVIGALLGAAVYVPLVVWLGGSRGFAYETLPILTLVAWVGVGFAVLGDLFESAIKRQAGVKDSGALLPGHGGLLDRIDALTSTLPLAAFAMMLQK